MLELEETAEAPSRRPLRAPSLQLQLLESWASVEMAAMVTANPMLRMMGGGDRIPVLVLPGFAADDTSTVMLRSYLRAWGYWAHGWRAGSNLGPTRRAIAAVRERLD